MNNEKVSKIIFILFNVGLIIYFAIAFLFPIQTGFWLAKTGFSILIFEFLSVFALVPGFALSMPKPAKYIFLAFSIPFIFGSFIFAFIFSLFVFHTIFILLFFISSSLLKVYYSRNNDAISIGKHMSNIMISIIIGSFIAILLSAIFSGLFANQQEVLRNFMISDAQASNSTVSGVIVDSPIYLAFWGIAYFALFLYRELKTN